MSCEILVQDSKKVSNFLVKYLVIKYLKNSEDVI